MSHINESLLTEKNGTYRCICVRQVGKIQVAMHKGHSRSGSAAVRGLCRLFVVFHRGISTYRSAATVQNRGVCFLLLNYGGQKTIWVRGHRAASISGNKYGENRNPCGWHLKFRKLESGIQRVGLRNPESRGSESGIQNPEGRNPESGIQNPKGWNAESNTSVDAVTWG